MDLDELFPDKPDDPLTLLTKQDLDPLSVEELRGPDRHPRGGNRAGEGEARPFG